VVLMPAKDRIAGTWAASSGVAGGLRAASLAVSSRILSVVVLLRPAKSDVESGEIVEFRRFVGVIKVLLKYLSINGRSVLLFLASTRIRRLPSYVGEVTHDIYDGGQEEFEAVDRRRYLPEAFWSVVPTVANWSPYLARSVS